MAKTIYEATDRFLNTCRTPHDKVGAEAKVAKIKEDQNSRMHKFTKVATKVVATAGMQTATMSAVYSVGNAVSEGLTGESLHGVGLAVTSVAAVSLGLGVGVRTYMTVGTGLDMIDERRLKDAEDELQSFNDSDEEEDDAVDSL